MPELQVKPSLAWLEPGFMPSMGAGGVACSECGGVSFWALAGVEEKGTYLEHKSLVTFLLLTFAESSSG